jgi:HIV Tat-specific factor 1
MSLSPSAPRPPNGDENSQGGFPTVIERFGDDPRISWSRLDNKWVLESDDGAEYHFDDALKRWIPVVSCFASVAVFSFDFAASSLSNLGP